MIFSALTKIKKKKINKSLGIFKRKVLISPPSIVEIREILNISILCGLIFF